MLKFLNPKIYGNVLRKKLYKTHMTHLNLSNEDKIERFGFGIKGHLEEILLFYYK